MVHVPRGRSSSEGAAGLPAGRRRASLRSLMASTWHKWASPLLFLLTAVALAAPAAGAGGRDGRQAVEDERHGEGPGRCQWLLAAACCDELPSVAAAPTTAPPAPAVWRGPPRGARDRLPTAYRAPAPTAQGRALATTVLRL